MVVVWKYGPKLRKQCPVSQILKYSKYMTGRIRLKIKEARLALFDHVSKQDLRAYHKKAMEKRKGPYKRAN